MKFTRFEHASAFRERAESFLLAHEAEHNLILGLSAILVQQPNYYGEESPYMATVEQDDVVVAAVLMTPPHNLILSRIDTAETLTLLARDLASDRSALPGVLGPPDASATFARLWNELTGQTYRLDVAERIYQLDKVVPVTGVPGQMRQATMDDRELLSRWITAFGHEALNNDAPAATEATVRRFLGIDVGMRGCYFWEDGVPVAMAGYSGPTPNGIRVGPVYTPPEHRRQGYASACVAALSQMLLDRGRHFCFLYTDLANPTSNHIYQNVGYQPVCDVDAYAFGTINET